MFVLLFVLIAATAGTRMAIATDWSHGEHAKLNTQDADPLGAGTLQLQLNLGFDRSTWPWQAPVGAEREHYEGAASFVMTFGVSDRLDLALETGHAWLADDESRLHPGHGPSDARAAAKWRIYTNESQRTTIAFLPGLTAPTGPENTLDHLRPGQGVWSLDARVALVRDWSEDWSTNVDAGYEMVVSGPDGAGFFSTNVAVGWRAHRVFQPEAELNYGVAAGGVDLLSVTLGAVFPVSPRLCLRTGARSAIAGQDPARTNAVVISTDVNL